MARMAGLFWVGATAVALAGLALPGAPREHVLAVVVVAVLSLAHGLFCLLGAPWTVASIRAHGIGSVVLYPAVGVALWATGGAQSYLTPLLLFSLFFNGWFFPPRWAAGLTAWLIAVVASPLLYDGAAVLDSHFLSRLLAFAAAGVAIVVIVARLKQRLQDAERRQRDMANQDPLTGLPNRWAFDTALGEAIVAAGDPLRGRRAGDADELGPGALAVLFCDVDAFKSVNDGFGHATGDRVLREIAAHGAAVVRPGDTFARIGGDEFAVVAPGAGPRGAQRLARALEAAVAQVRAHPDAEPMAATVTVASFPRDGATAGDLLLFADRALHARKDAREPGSRLASPAA